MTNILRETITELREREARVAVRFVRGWAICTGCEQSCTGSYLGQHCCTRCGKVVT